MTIIIMMVVVMPFLNDGSRLHGLLLPVMIVVATGKRHRLVVVGVRSFRMALVW